MTYAQKMMDERRIGYLDGRKEGLEEGMEQGMDHAQGITETLKATDQMVWVGKMNNLRASAREIVNNEIIFI